MHLFNIKQQLKSMKDHACIIHVDSCGEAAHFASNQHQATPHTGVLHVGGVEWHVCSATISPSKEEAPAATWTYVSPILNLVKDSYPKVTMVYFFSDGPCTQYRQKGNFYLSCTKLQECGFQSGTWNFFEASHGKGATHGVGGLLKRTVDSPVSHGKDNPMQRSYSKPWWMFRHLWNFSTFVRTV